ncbi:hypothetical protein BDV27DRAFT_131738 [Aspergillus caelatus]|uniref:Uncharacterized protein n=2 Tax=Aspergillus subgen. Circumdati TaxID=2720871 RepID=A0A5N6ZXE4_9EURO|nr:uncharacterized protein BDV27DRAFT_131738 [Aspergillus caelatus]KAE8362284.1 hypothetical protein BDV27DRAFT_131738 [Aspergillus caelatus]KAE8417201.1 hypothetical protein BDV36DRAFT_257737 [Aspergillus pseudocaelatus]
MDSPSSVMSSPSKVLNNPLSSPTKALNPLSPERLNQQTFPNSPTLPNDVRNMQRKPRGLSDVQAKVAYLNNLSRGNSPAASSTQPSAGSSAALQRAILGREEAESALANVSVQLSEAQSRERRISERLESLLEELQTAKTRQAHERAVFEKEIRKARKEAFRAGSVLVKAQEELKQARFETKVLKDEVQSEREAKEKAKQEAFERAYTLAGLMEEIEVLKGRLRTAEAKSHAHTLEARAQEMHKRDVGRLSLAEGDLAFLQTPTPRRPKRSAEESDDTPLESRLNHSFAQDTPPKRPRVSDVTPRNEIQKLDSLEAKGDSVHELQIQLESERQLRVNAEDMIEFLKVECMFKRCTCRIEEEREKGHIQNTTEHATKKLDGPGEHIDKDEPAGAKPHIEDSPSSPHKSSGQPIESAEEPETENQQQPEETTITFSPATGTFHTIPSPVRRSPTKKLEHDIVELPQLVAENQSTPQPQVTSPLAKYEVPWDETPFETIHESRARGPLSPSRVRPSPATSDVPWDSEVPKQHRFEGNVDEHDSIRRIPLRNESVEPDHLHGIPGTPIDREEALAQIRARRGRTNNMKRSVSANESTLRAGGMGVTPVRAARRIPAVQNPDGRYSEIRSRRDMSAPVRMFHR